MPMIYTPGLLSRLLTACREINLEDKVWAMDAIMAGWPTLPLGLLRALIREEVAYEVDKSSESVILTITDEQEAEWWPKKEVESGA